VKYHFKTDQGIEFMTQDEGDQMAAADGDYHQRDLYDSIKRGDFPSWTLKMQIMPFEDAKTYRFNPFDLTKVWPHGDYPLIEVGRLTLDRNVSDCPRQPGLACCASYGVRYLQRRRASFPAPGYRHAGQAEGPAGDGEPPGHLAEDEPRHEDNQARDRVGGGAHLSRRRPRESVGPGGEAQHGREQSQVDDVQGVAHRGRTKLGHKLPGEGQARRRAGEAAERCHLDG
jgi:hypothetical protein